MNTKRENIRHGRGKSFEIECPQGFASIEAIDPGIEPVEVGFDAGVWGLYLLQKGRV